MATNRDELRRVGIAMARAAAAGALSDNEITEVSRAIATRRAGLDARDYHEASVPCDPFDELSQPDWTPVDIVDLPEPDLSDDWRLRQIPRSDW